MSAAASAALTQDLVDRYGEDGIVVLRSFFSDWVEPLRAGVERLMADPSPLEAQRADHRRRGDGARRCARLSPDRGGKPSPLFPDLDLRHGAPLDAPEFPVIFHS